MSSGDIYLGPPPDSQEELILAEACPLVEQPLTYKGLFHRYAVSDYGRWQASQEMRYRHEFSSSDVNTMALIGVDAHPLLHGPFLERTVTRPFLYEQNFGGKPVQRFTDDQIKAVRFGSLIHDIGECEHPEFVEMFGRTIGDIQRGYKTAEDKVIETKIRQFLVAKFYSDVPQNILDMAEDMIAHGTADGFLTDAFDAIHAINFYESGVAFGLNHGSFMRGISTEGLILTDEDIEILPALSKEIIGNQQARLVAFGTRFPYAAAALRASQAPRR